MLPDDEAIMEKLVLFPFDIAKILLYHNNWMQTFKMYSG